MAKELTPAEKEALNSQIRAERLRANAQMGTEAREAIDPSNGDHRGLGRHKSGSDD